MHPAIYIAGLIVGFLLTALASYYKARSEFRDKLQDYISKDECRGCSIKTEVQNVIRDIKQITKDLKEGSRLFSQLKVDTAVIKDRLGVKNDLDELKKMVRELEKESESK